MIKIQRRLTNLLCGFDVTDWTCNSASELEEQLRMEANKSLGVYRWCSNYIQLFVRYVDIDIGQISQVSDGLRTIRAGDYLCRYLLFGYFFYYICKCSILTWLHYNHDVLLGRWRPRLRAETTQLRDKCAQLDDILMDQAAIDLLTQIHGLQYWLNRLGAFSTYLTGTSVIGLNSVTVYLLSTTIAVRLYLKWRPVRASFICFLLEPNLERQLLRKRIGQLEDRFQSSLLHRQPIVEIELSKDLSLHVFRQRQLSSAQRIELAKLYKWLRRRVRPSSRTAAWHRRLLKLYTYGNIASLFINFFTAVVFTSIMIGGELMVRAQLRLDHIECQSRTPNGTLIRGAAQQLAQLSPGHNQIYLQSLARPVTYARLLKLGWDIEVHYFMGLSQWVFLVETYVSVIVAFQIIAFIISTYIYETTDRALWRIQVDVQLLKTKQLIEAQDFSSPDCHLKLLERSIVAHLNYTLFKSFYPQFQRYVSFLTAQMSLQSIELMVVAYLVAVNTQCRVVLVTFFCQAYMLAVTNYYLINGSIFYSSITRLMKTISKLVVLSGTSGYRPLQFMADLWRRQLLLDDEMRHFFAFSAFNINLSYDKVFLFTAYLSSLWTLLIRNAG